MIFSVFRPLGVVHKSVCCAGCGSLPVVHEPFDYIVYRHLSMLTVLIKFYHTAETARMIGISENARSICDDNRQILY
jgi:hypothetical protein